MQAGITVGLSHGGIRERLYIRPNPGSSSLFTQTRGKANVGKACEPADSLAYTAAGSWVYLDGA